MSEAIETAIQDTRSFYRQMHSQLKITPRKQMILYYTMPYLAPNRFVLDIGCGDGYITAMMAMFAKVCGWDRDISPAVQSRFPYVRFRNSPFEDLAAEKYDIVTVFDVLEHVPPEERAAMLCIVRDCLQKGGLLILNQPEAADKSQPFDSPISVAEAINLCQDSGFKPIQLNHYAILPQEQYNFMVFKYV
jgi:2-polyprenyl-3-methyl-5-hydroxy-6-metoxy-1,4-benzoquinol methylase